MAHSTKRVYHPLMILMYTSGMLTQEQLQEIPKTTKHNWNSFIDQDYYGYSIVSSYIRKFNDIKEIHASTYTRRAIEFILHTRKGYYDILGELKDHKNLMKLHVDKIVSAVDYIRNKTNITARKACKLYGISKDWYYTEKRRVHCTLSPIQRCYKQYSNQLAQAEIKIIEEEIHKPQNHNIPLSTIYYKQMRNKAICCAKSTFYKYTKALGYVKQKLKHKAIFKKGLKASYVFEWLHIDITYVNTLRDGVQKVAFVKDNYSSALLHVKSTSEKAGSEFISQLLQEAFEKHKLHNRKQPINILSDGGSENKGLVTSWIKKIEAPPVVKKITALSEEFPFSNAMSESTHRTYKSDFMQGKVSTSKEEHMIHLLKFMTYYNNDRYPCRLYGRTPIEVLKGEKIDRQLFKESIQQRKQKRVEENKDFNQCFQKLGCYIISK